MVQPWRQTCQGQPLPPFEGRFWSYGALRKAQLRAGDHAHPLVVIFSGTEHERWLAPPEPGELAAFMFGSPRSLKEPELAGWLGARFDELGPAVDAVGQLSGLLLNDRNPPIGGQRKPYARHRAIVEDALRTGLRLRLRPPPEALCLSVSEEEAFAYLAGLASAALPSRKTVPPAGLRVCQVCARVFSTPHGRKTCLSCNNNQVRGSRVWPTPSELVVLPGEGREPIEHGKLDVGELEPFGGRAAIARHVADAELTDAERDALTALYGLRGTAKESVEQVAAKWLPIDKLAGLRYRVLRAVERGAVEHSSRPGTVLLPASVIHWMFDAGQLEAGQMRAAGGILPDGRPARPLAHISSIMPPTACTLRWSGTRRRPN